MQNAAKAAMGDSHIEVINACTCAKLLIRTYPIAINAAIPAITKPTGFATIAAFSPIIAVLATVEAIENPIMVNRPIACTAWKVLVVPVVIAVITFTHAIAFFKKIKPVYAVFTPAKTSPKAEIPIVNADTPTTVPPITIASF